jgi:SAM-dependent methyltransferase
MSEPVADDKPLVWHYGLMAERWGEFLREAPELPFFRREIERHGEPVLDLACGAGRLLIPLLAAGVDVDGCDISPDMLEQCRKAAEAAGFRPTLSAQPMHDFRLARRYRTIYICDSLGLSGSREHDLATLRRCREHLQDGGALLVTVDAEYTDAEGWDHWLPSGRAAMPEPWPEDTRRRVAADGSEHLARFRFLSVDPLEQTYTREVQLEKWRDGELVATETYVLRGNMYLKPEMLLMLQVAGFHSITVRGDYTDDPATPDSEKLVLTAIR